MKRVGRRNLVDRIRVVVAAGLLGGVAFLWGLSYVKPLPTRADILFHSGSLEVDSASGRLSFWKLVTTPVTPAQRLTFMSEKRGPELRFAIPGLVWTDQVGTDAEWEFNNYRIGERSLVIDYWLIACGAAVVAAGLAVTPLRRRHRRAHGHCLVCGYDLRSGHARCPECGASV